MVIEEADFVDSFGRVADLTQRLKVVEFVAAEITGRDVIDP